MKTETAVNLTGRRLGFKSWYLIWIPVLALGIQVLPASADTLYNNFGPSGDLYDANNDYTVCGFNACGDSFSVASLFTVSGTGLQQVLQIDLAVAYAIAPDSFDASIWTDVGGMPGTQVANAAWDDLPVSQPIGSCCDAIVTIPGSDINGVNLIAGDQYFMILSQNSTQDNADGWYYNYQDSTGIVLSSIDGGAWQAISSSPNPLAAFDVLGTPVASVPEPVALELFTIGIVGLFAARRGAGKCQ